jgi:glutathione S-transferase
MFESADIVRYLERTYAKPGVSPRRESSLAGLVIAAALCAGAAGAQTQWQSAEVLGETIAPGQKWLLSWVSGDSREARS